MPKPRIPRQTWRGDGRSLACPVCESERLRVVNTRHHGGTVRRERRCVGCGYKFFTAEHWCDENGKVVDASAC